MLTPLPLPEPPAVDVAVALDELRTARRELADAGRIVYMLGVEPPTGDLRRWLIEQQVAERRCELWAIEVAAAVERARTLGLDVAAVL